MSRLGLADVFAEMHALMLGERDVADAAKRLDTTAERLEVYAPSMREQVWAALVATYTLLPRLVGPDAWGRLAEEYVRVSPPSTWELNACTSGFVAFLEARCAAGDSEVTEFVVELARLERAELEVALAEGDTDERRETAMAPGVAPPSWFLNPTLRVLEFRYPVARAAAHMRSTGEAFIPAAAQEVAFVFRHPATLTYRSLPADAELLFAFKVAHDGLSELRASIESGLSNAEVSRLMRDAIRAGLVSAHGGE